MKRTLLLLCFVFLLCGCGKEPPVETTVPVTTEAQISETAAATEWIIPEVAPVTVETVDTLPAPAENALFSTQAVGGNPRFLVFEEGLTYYVVFYGDLHTTSFLSVEKCTLSLPNGCTNGRITNGSSGAGSGEVLLYVTAERGDKTVYLDYLFYCDNIAVPVSVWEGERTPIRPE